MRFPRALVVAIWSGLAATTSLSAADAPPVPLQPAAPPPLDAGGSRDVRPLLTGAARDQRVAELAARVTRATIGTRPRDRASRFAFAQELREWKELRRARAIVLAQAAGLPLDGVLPDGRVFALVDFSGGRPLYVATTNVNAAISTAANLVRQTAPFNVSGAGLDLGIWDGGLVRTTHQELTGRIIAAGDTSTPSDHATHVAGTMIASGVNPSALGMAPSARLISYEFTNDVAEMALWGAAIPGEPGAVPLSNHSYSFIGGWNFNGTNPVWYWWGVFVDDDNPASDYEPDFGRYSVDSAALDNVVWMAPYYLPFFAAANDRNNNPLSGSSWRVIGAGMPNKSYDAAKHPAGDGIYKNGYDTMTSDAVAKNILTVGAVNDAVTMPGGLRSLAAATMTSFSSWGPADDGRIKPDVVANGANLFSSVATSNTAYDGTYSGTSMATPNASGSAALLVDYFRQQFPGVAMRASTLKALVIHTADDLGTAGPDYANGWGLMNTLAAAQLITDHRTNSGRLRMVEGRLSATKTSETFSYLWDGISPIRATLVWTDPPGAAKAGHEDRAPALVNNLDLWITNPGAGVHRPFIMPHVGAWTLGSLGTAATTGVNNVDNVEQVLIAAPPAAGEYQVHVALSGVLTGDAQAFSLVVSGLQHAEPAMSPSISAWSGAYDCSTGQIAVTIDGAGFQFGGTPRLARAGQSDMPPAGPEVLTDAASAVFDRGGFASGQWNLVMANPDDNSFVIPAAVIVPVTVAREGFEDSAPGWTTDFTNASGQWGISSSRSYSGTKAAFAPNLAATSDARLLSPSITLPADAECLTLTFKHWFHVEPGWDGGVLEVSFDGGLNWSDVTAAGGTFTVGGYNGTLNTGNPIGSAGRPIWTGVSGGFMHTAVVLSTGTYGGQTVQFRWRFGSDAIFNRHGWYVDDVALFADHSTGWGAFDYWRHNVVGDAAADQDGDGDADGWSLFGEYSFGGDPSLPDGAPAEVAVEDGYLAITFAIRLEATDVTYTVQTTTDVSGWTDAAVYTSNGAAVARNASTETVQTAVVADGALVRVTERCALPMAAEPRRFLRVVAHRTF